VTFQDPFESAARVLPLLEAEGVDVVVALTHLDFKDDVRLARRFPQIDLILGGHEHFPITTHVERALIVKPGSDARHVSRMDISKPSIEEPIETHFELYPIDQELAEDAATAKVVARWESELDQALDVVVGSTAAPLDAVAESVRSGESNLGNLMADAMRWDTEADIAILNAGSIRSNRIYPPGDLRRRDLVAMHPFGGIVCAVEITGQTVIDALNHGFGRLGESTGRFPQVAGIRFEVDPERPAGDRVHEIVVGTTPLEKDRLYTVAIGDYMLAGGDGYTMFASARVTVGPEQGNMLVTALENLVSDVGQVDPGNEGRIRFAGDPVPEKGRRGVILDTDMGIDSVMGMLYLLRAPEIDVRAVTIVHGISDVKHGARNAVRVLELTGDRDIPVARGARRPLEGKRSFPEFWKRQANGLGGAQLPDADRKPARRAVDLIIRTLQGATDPLSIVAMGPLTNIAEALERDPGIVENIHEVLVMGGALAVHGNVGTPFVGIDNYAAEWNFYLDPHAAERVLKSGVRIRLLPLDATHTLPVTPGFVDRIRQRPRDETSGLLLALLEVVDEGIRAGWYYFWDSLAAVAVARPDILTCREEGLTIETRSGTELGKSTTDDDAPIVCVGEEVNRESFEEHFLKALLE
jgi:inosine-uridine nucleoside N-ribohydrolase